MTIDIRPTAETRDDTHDRVMALLDTQALAKGHSFNPEQIAFEAWAGDEFLGGLTARISLDWMFVMLLAVSEPARGRGIGQRLLNADEDAARERNAAGIWLDTFSFQAPGFYQRMGYARFGRLPDYPAGQSRNFFAKRLQT